MQPAHRIAKPSADEMRLAYDDLLAKGVLMTDFSLSYFPSEGRDTWLKFSGDPVYTQGTVFRFPKEASPEFMFAYNRVGLEVGLKSNWLFADILKTREFTASTASSNGSLTYQPFPEEILDSLVARNIISNKKHSFAVPCSQFLWGLGEVLVIKDVVRSARQDNWFEMQGRELLPNDERDFLCCSSDGTWSYAKSRITGEPLRVDFQSQFAVSMPLIYHRSDPSTQHHCENLLMRDPRMLADPRNFIDLIPYIPTHYSSQQLTELHEALKQVLQHMPLNSIGMMNCLNPGLYPSNARLSERQTEILRGYYSLPELKDIASIKILSDTPSPCQIDITCVLNITRPIPQRYPVLIYGIYKDGSLGILSIDGRLENHDKDGALFEHLPLACELAGFEYGFFGGGGGDNQLVMLSPDSGTGPSFHALNDSCNNNFHTRGTPNLLIISLPNDTVITTQKIDVATF